VIVQALVGRTVEQRRQLSRGLTDAVVDAFGVSPTSVTVVIQEVELENYAKGGVLEVDRADTPTASARREGESA
jgi:4-oxalocrotonate tautomerase